MKFIWKMILLAMFCMAFVQAVPRQKRLTVAEYMPSYYYSNIGGNPNVYSFGYDIRDPSTGNNQFRAEDRHPNGTVTGNYGYIDPSGAPQRFRYIADRNGYRVYPDLPTPFPIRKPLLGNEDVESSVTWTRPAKKPNKITNNFMPKLGVMFRRSFPHV